MSHKLSLDGPAVLVVDGEASESDTEVQTEGRVESATSSQVFVVSGEAPESDEERSVILRTRIDSPAEKTDDDLDEDIAPNEDRHKSLLHRKLWECNQRLRSSVEGLLTRTCEQSIAKLSAADKLLLSAQESQRASNTNLALARARLRQVKLELEQANCTAAFPTLLTR